MIRRTLVPLAIALLALPTIAIAQPADLPIPAATTDKYPDGVRVVAAKSGTVYANKKGQLLYGMDMRTLLRWGPDPAKYCSAACAENWIPLLAPKEAVPNIEYPRGFGGPQSPVRPGFVRPQGAPDWTIIEGAQGPQYVYKGWHLVFVRKAAKAGAADFDGAEARTWNTLKFVPPVPVINAPVGVKPVFADGAYALADKDGRMLYSGKCAKDCAGWVPLGGGAASAGIGEWTISNNGDAPQWHFRGSPVFVSSGDTPDSVPAEGKVLRP